MVSQPVWKKKFSSFNQAMAGPRTCHSSCCNLPLGGEDELTKGPPKAPIEASNTSTHSPAVF